MCGRLFCLFNSRKELIESVQKELGIEVNSADFEYSGPRYNISPSTSIPVILPNCNLKQLNWGFKAGKIFIINARNEEIEEKVSFKNLIDRERCVVICSGYYEWHCERDKTKSPFSFIPEGKTICFLAALRNPKNDSIVLVTREAIPSIHHIHNRMPVVMENDLVSKWMDPKYNYNQLKSDIINNNLKIKSTALAKHVNSITNTGPECLQSIKEYKEESFAKGLGKFFKKTKLDSEQQ